MNPFDLTGPPFLLFFVVLSVGVFFGMWFFRKALESGDSPAFDTSDAYLIAHLRGGSTEAARVATVSLIERKLLTVGADGKITFQNRQKDAARNPLEHAILAYFINSNDPVGMFKDPGVKQAAEWYRERLSQMGALPSAAQKTQRLIVFAVGLGLLLGVGILKIELALERGRHNIGFLIALMIIDVFVGIGVGFPRLTALGKSMVQDLQALFSRLKPAKTSKAHGTPNEAAMIAAVFGIAAMPALGYPYVRQVFPKASTSSSAACGSSCGSSSSDSGGGSSCGGGCGGGCGGCGS
jgi:uncharacterized protein (TIGR04222 family)